MTVFKFKTKIKMFKTNITTVSKYKVYMYIYKTNFNTYMFKTELSFNFCSFFSTIYRINFNI